MKKVCIILTNEQYDLLLKGLFEAEASIDRQIEAREHEGGSAPNLAKYSLAFYELRQDIKKQIEAKANLDRLVETRS